MDKKRAYFILQSHIRFRLEKSPMAEMSSGFFAFPHMQKRYFKIFAEFCNFFGPMVENAQKIGITIMKAICGTMFCVALLR